MMTLTHFDYSRIRLRLSLGHLNRHLQTRHVTPLNRRAEWLRREQYLGLSNHFRVHNTLNLCCSDVGTEGGQGRVPQHLDGAVAW